MTTADAQARRLQTAARMYSSARELKAAALKARHPTWSRDRILLAVRKAFLHGSVR
jgi:hypothetical protein